MPGDIDAVLIDRRLLAGTIGREGTETADSVCPTFGEHGVLNAVHEFVLERHPLRAFLYVVDAVVVVVVVFVIGRLSQQVVGVDVALEDRPTGRRRRCSHDNAAAAVVVIGRRRPRRTAAVSLPVRFSGGRRTRAGGCGRRRSGHPDLTDPVIRVVGAVGGGCRSRSHGHRRSRSRAEVLAVEERAARPAAAAAAVANRTAGIAFVQPTVGVPHGLGQRAAGRHAVELGPVWPATAVVVAVLVTAVPRRAAVAAAAAVNGHRRRLRRRYRARLESFGQRHGRGHRFFVAAISVPA